MLCAATCRTAGLLTNSLGVQFPALLQARGLQRFPMRSYGYLTTCTWTLPIDLQAKKQPKNYKFYTRALLGRELCNTN